jgi:site-specific DNA recombinase
MQDAKMIFAGRQAEREEKIVGIWVRVSTGSQAYGESAEHLKNRAKANADSNGWKVGRIYRLSGASAHCLIDRSNTEAMLGDIKTGNVFGLIISELEHPVGNTRELLSFAEYAQENRADIICLSEPIGTSTGEDGSLYALIAAFPQWEYEKIGNPVTASIRTPAKMGKSLGGAAPFGYRREDHKLILDEREAPIRRMIFDLFLKHKRLKTVARALNDAGYRTRSGQRFSDTTVRRLVEDPLAKGQRRSNYTESTGKGKHWSPKSPEKWIFSDAPALISPEVWEAANALLSKRKNGEPPRKRSVHLFSSLAQCDCGGRFTVLWRSRNYTCRKCRRKIGIKDLEALFREQLRAFLLSPEEVRQYLEAGDSTLAQNRKMHAALGVEQAQVRSAMDKTYQLYLAAEISPAGFGERYGPLELRMAELMEETQRLQAETDLLISHHLSSEKLVSEAQVLSGRWEELESDEKRQAVESIVQRIVVSKSSAMIDFLHTHRFTEDLRSGVRRYSGQLL